MNFAPGTLIRARGREWIVLSGLSNAHPEVLRVRPLSGSEEDQTLLHPALEAEPVTSATFAAPDPGQLASHESAQLLKDALQLSLRRGAGPFRCFGQIAVRPRSYQLVPLMMALRQETVRLLIADDVGIGKTIEGALIAREMLDRGDIDRFTVLCPPHLVDQWVSELETHFHLGAVAVTAASAARLERDLPQSSIFTAHPRTVVSLDYIKNDRRRAEFLRTCPDLVLVDEAHTCAATGQGRHQRFELLRALADAPDRHLVLLTATPHSGDEAAFFRLLGLLDRDFAVLATASQDERGRLRERLARHLVQRRRLDIDAWNSSKPAADGETLFPRRETAEFTYRLTGDWEVFFHAVLDYCRDVVQAAGDERRQRLNFWGTLALMRCVASSPAAALSALRTRAGLPDEADQPGEDEADLELRVMDGAADSLPDDDQEPTRPTDDPALESLMAQAQALLDPKSDPKMKVVAAHLEKLLRDGFSPVVFCRYLATADYLGDFLKETLKDTAVSVVTGELTADERKVAVEALGADESRSRRVLVATDCLSEGINLQHLFDAVVHYDLSWNPTRHEQREGRVDRFGQKSKVVRASLLYGENNPVDGAVLQVILRKAAKIKEELGVPVPVPVEGAELTRALLKAVLLSRRYGEAPQSEQLDLFTVWESAADKANRHRTLFAQQRLKPADVLPELGKTLAALGDATEVRRFTERALARLGSGLQPWRSAFKAPISALPSDVQERLELLGLSGTIALDFANQPAPRCHWVQRSHPLVQVLAETLLSRTLGQVPVGSGVSPGTEPAVLGRAGCWFTDAVHAQTTLVLLRLRHQIATTRARRTSTVFVEEAAALAWQGAAGRLLTPDEALALFAAPPAGDVETALRERMLTRGLALVTARQAEIEHFARQRADALLADHDRVRTASAASGSSAVTALLPADVIGLYILLPRVD